jgi:hypothetical protein
MSPTAADQPVGGVRAIYKCLQGRRMKSCVWWYTPVISKLAGPSLVLGRPGQHGETVSKKPKKKNSKEVRI